MGAGSRVSREVAWTGAGEPGSEVEPAPGSSAGGGGRARRGRGQARGGPAGPTPGSLADAAPEADPESVARAICLRQLTMAPRTRAQLAEAMARRDVPDGVAERVLDRFTEVGLVDDAAYAQAWVRSRHTGRGLARRALAQELRHRGVDDDLVKDAVETLAPDQELATARDLVARRLTATRGLAPQVRTRRLAGLLARKGYPSGLAFRVVREALDAEGPDGGGRDPGVLPAEGEDVGD